MTHAPRLTLVAEFDDLVRNNRVLTQGIESEFEKFVRFQEEWRKRLAISEDEKQELISRIKHIERENVSLETQLKHARGQIDKELKKRRLIEAERQSLDHQIGMVREMLNNKDRDGILDEKDRQQLEFINSDYHVSHQYYSPMQNLSMIEESCSLLSDADISYDKTEEDIDTSYLRSGRMWKRQSRQMQDMEVTENQSPDKKKRRRSRRRHRRSRSANAAVVTTHVSIGADVVDAEAEIETAGGKTKRIHSVSPGRRTLRKCNSADPVNAGSTDDLYSTRNYNASPRSILRELNKQVTPPSGTMRRHNSGNNLNRPHTFMPRTLLRPGGETCIPCGKRIAFGNKAVKCKGCNVLAHPECKEDAPLPCIACNFTPNRNIKSALADYAPQDPPCIPAIVIHCINEVEERGLTEQGIYRVPGSEKEVRELKEKFFKGKGMPCLTNVLDINVICGCLKSFLKGLKEPLVTYKLWERLVSGATLPDTEEAYSAIYQVVSELPRANRDTLAFVVLHLQKVSESPATLMNTSNLSKVFGPTVIGYSGAEITDQQMFRQTQQGQKVMELLMNMSQDYWRNFIKEDDISLYPQHTTTGLDSPYNTPHRDKQIEFITPETLKKSAVYESMLGPITTPTSYNESRRGWLTTPRSVRGKGSVTGRKNYFASPVL